MVEEIAQIGRDPDLRATVIAQHEQNRKAEIAEAVTSRRKLDRQLQQLGTSINEAAAKGEAAQLADLQRQQTETSAALAELHARIATLSDQQLSEEELHRAVESFSPVWESLTTQERQRVLRLLIQHVTYTGDTGEIAVTFRATGIKTMETEVATCAQ